MFPDVTETVGHALVVDGEQIAALAGDDAGGGNANRFAGRFFAVHQVFEQRRTAVTQGFQIGVYARNRRAHRVRGQEIIFRPDNRYLFRHVQAGAFARFQHVQRLLIVGRENSERLGRRFQLGQQPFAFVLPLFPVRAIGRRLVPPQPEATVPRSFQRFEKSLSAFLIRPVVRVAVIHEVVKTPREKMLGGQLRGMGVIFQHAGKAQLRTAEAEIHCGLFGVRHEFRQIVAGAKPRQNPVALPPPRNDLLPGQIRGEMPVVFLGEFFNAAMQPVIIPAEGNQDPLLAFARHKMKLNQARVFFNHF